MNKTYFTWQDFDKAVDNLVPRLQNSAIDCVYGIPRGGLILAVVLSHKLNKPLLTDFFKTFEKAMAGNKILIVDDISDTGVTLGRLHSLGSCTATIHYVTSSTYKPDFWVHEKIQGDWIVYPWESE